MGQRAFFLSQPSNHLLVWSLTSLCPPNLRHLVNLQIPLFFSHSSSLTLLTCLPPASTPVPSPGLALTIDLHTEEAGFHTSPTSSDLLDLWSPGKGSLAPTPLGEWEVAVGCHRRVCSQAGLIPVQCGCGGWDFLPGSTRPGHNGGYQSPSGG